MERQLQSTTLRIHGVNDETFFLLFDWWPSQQTGFPKSKRATKLTKTTNLSAMSHPSRMSHGALLSTLQIANKKSLRNLLFFDFTMWRPLICAAPCREPHQPILRKKNHTIICILTKLTLEALPWVIFQIGQENPELLVAHAYTRYLGDLSGGQVLGKITQKSLGLSSKEGLSFFSFPGVSSPNRFKQLYRSRMNSVELTEEEKAAVLEEAVDAFELNIQVREQDSGLEVSDRPVRAY